MWCDIGAIAVILWFAYRGASRGAVWQLAALASVGLCVLFAGQLRPLVEGILPEQVTPAMRPSVSIAIVYLGISLLTFLVARKVRLWFEKSRFVEFDRHWGAILGAAKGLLAVLVVVAGIVGLVPPLRSVIRESKTGMVAKLASQIARPMLPDSVGKALDEAFEPVASEELPLSFEPPKFDSFR